MKKKIILKIFAFLLVVGFVGFFSYETGVFAEKERQVKQQPAYLIDTSLEKPQAIDFAIFWEAWNRLTDNFIDKDKLDSQKMVYGAIEGMVESIGDPYTTFFTPAQAESFNEELSGEYEGVGMVVGMRDSQVTVVSPFKASPAETAGLKPEDKIFKIDDTFTDGLTIEEAVKIIKGPKGTSVRLLILRADWKEPKEFVIERANIKIPTLEKEMRIDEKIAIVKIYQFNKILPQEFSQAAQEIISSQTKKIIIDLRNNPGGFLEVATNVTSWFVKEGDVITWQDKGQGKEKKAYKSEGPATLSKYPTVVLINSGSASASEIMAGALRDQLGVKLIGKKSFGKGSVQEQINLSDRSSLKITIAKWLTPKGDSIDKEGLTPDIEVEEGETEEGKDSQMEKAIEFLNSLK